MLWSYILYILIKTMWPWAAGDPTRLKIQRLYRVFSLRFYYSTCGRRAVMAKSRYTGCPKKAERARFSLLWYSKI